MSPSTASPSIAALAGRRIDPPDNTTERFPLRQVSAVKAKLLDTLHKERVGLLICSAACGADLLALEAAAELGICSRIILPFAPNRFRETSVIDRPGDWGPLFDCLVLKAQKSGNLIILSGDPNSESAYGWATTAIIEETQKAAQGKKALGIIVWEGAGRSGNDSTDEFRRLAAAAGLEERTIITMESAPSARL